MLRRTASVWAALAALAALGTLAGCRAGQNLHGVVDIAQWTPEFDGSVHRAGGSSFDLVGQGGVPRKEPFYTFDVSTRLSTPRGNQAQPYSINLGYLHHVYDGSGPGGVSFQNSAVTLMNPTTTVAEFNLYKLSYEELRATQGSQGYTGGLIGLHFLDFGIEAYDASANRATFFDGAPVFVFGWRITQESGGLVYYVGLEGMDMDMISLENVEGSLMEYYGGMRWFIQGRNAAISIGYRTYEADLDIGGDKLSVKFDGATFGLYLNW